MRGLFEMFELSRFQCGGNQQHGIRTPGARLVNLIFVDDEVFTQYGQRTGGFGLFQVFGRALEVLFVS